MRNKADAILVGDIHYREDQPKCRTDDFWETQKRKSTWLKELWEENERCPILQPGDLFHRWNSSPRVISAVLEYLPPMITIPGNPGRHNYFNLDGFDRDALNVIAKSNTGWEVLTENWYRHGKLLIHPLLWGGESIAKPRGLDGKTINVLLTHRMLSDSGNEIFESELAMDFMDKNDGFDLILSGHNHKQFGIRNRKQIELGRGSKSCCLINPGSFTRQSASETHEPAVYLWYSNSNRVSRIQVPHDEDAVSREHLDIEKERNENITAFVEKLKDDNMEISVSFRSNVENLLRSKQVDKKVSEKVKEVVYGD